MRRILRRTSGDNGSVTAEFAMAMPAFVLLVLAAISCVAGVTVKLQCVAAAREAALVQARGGEGLSAGSKAAPPGARVQVGTDGNDVRATVSVALHPLGGRLPAVTVAADACAAREPGLP